jgi:aerobic-type carbon monoxide dehydrogenase small subunit (CoxS/CutS family)
MRSCLILSVQANQRDIRTIESLAEPDGTLSPMPAALGGHHGRQCGFCTPGMLMVLTECKQKALASQSRKRMYVTRFQAIFADALATKASSMSRWQF